MNVNRYLRVSIAVVMGIAAAIIVGLLLDWTLAPLAGWDTVVVIFVALILADFARDTPDETARMAKQDALSSIWLDTILVVASLASIGAVISLFSGKNTGTPHMVFGLVSIGLSWIMVQILYTLRYVTLYYRDAEGGIDFNNPSVKRPRFTDFVYVAFTVGMTYQISDTNVSDYRIRRTVLAHAVISFLFGMIIIASTINFLVSLAQ